MKKKLLFVTSRLPWPPNSGRRVSLYHYCRGLATVYGYEVSLFVFPEWDQARSAKDAPDFIREVRFAAPIGIFSKLKNLLLRGLFGKNRLPLQCALYYSKKNSRALTAFARELCPDVIVFDMLRTAPYMSDLKDTGARLLLDLDDLLSVRYARQLESFGAKNGIAGRYAGGMPSLVERVLCHGPLGRLILKSEQKRAARAEIFYARAADGVILVSEKETAALNEALGENKTVAVPTGVDFAAFEAARAAKKEPHVIGFVGNLSVAANVASLEYIVGEVLPKIKTPCRLEVVGPCPVEVRARFADVAGLTLCGEVPTLPPVMGRWQLFLSPIAFGSGIKTKILEAMAAGLPVLTNAVGAEGIAAEAGKDFLVLEDASDLAAAADRLLGDPATAIEIGENAAAFVKNHFDWDAVFAKFAKLEL